jgi:formylglycine-generating enzyme required for sulfatase activity
MRLAIVISANGPEGARDRLRFAERDGERISNILETRRCAFEVIRISGDTPAYEARRIIWERAEGCTTEDTFLVHFAGHGRSRNGELLLQLNGSTNDKPFTTHLVASEIIKAFQECKALNKILILDCCNAGNVARKVGVRGVGTPVNELGVKSDTFDIVMASGFLESAFEVESLGGGFLSHALVEAVDDRFHEADADGDRALSFEDVMSWLEKRAVEINKDRHDKIPTPARLGYGKGRSYFTIPPTEWVIHKLKLPNRTPAIVLPIRPKYSQVHHALLAFAIAQHPVTNAEYKQFVAATEYKEPTGQNFTNGQWCGPFRPWDDPAFSHDEQPVTCVSAADAGAYCNWLQRGTQDRGSERRAHKEIKAILLPSIEMWNVVAFGSTYGSSDPRQWRSRTPVKHHRSASPADCVGVTERANKLGVIDVIGNVWEWLGTAHEWERLFPTYPQFYPHQGTIRLGYRPGGELYLRQERELRGGSFLDDLDHIEPSIRVDRLEDGEDTRHSDLGFRVIAAVAVSALRADVQERLVDCAEIRITVGG